MDNALETRARRRWVGAIVAVFVAQATLWTVALQLTTDEPPLHERDR